MDTEYVTTLRKQEDFTYSRSLRPAATVVHLDHLDAPLRFGIAEEEVFSSDLAISEREVSDIVSALKTCIDESSIVFAPMGIGGHIDHIVSKRVGDVYVGLKYPVIFYEDLPYAAYSEVNSGYKSSLCCGETKSLLKLKVRTGVPMTKKVEAAKVYRSQIDYKTIDAIFKRGFEPSDSSVVERLFVSDAATSVIRVISLLESTDTVSFRSL